MRKIKSLALIVPFILLCAFSFPWDAQPQKKEEGTLKPKQIEELKKTPEEAKEEKNAFIATAEQTVEAKVENRKPAVLNQTAIQPVSVPTIPKIEKLPASRIKPIQPVQPIDRAPNIQKIQKQINDIIQLQESLKQTQQGQLSEIQRIIDQAKIHQRILDDIKMTKASRERVSTAATDQLLQQEKVRLIGRETEQNKKLLEHLAQQDETPKIEKIQNTQAAVTGTIVTARKTTGAEETQTGQSLKKSKES